MIPKSKPYLGTSEIGSIFDLDRETVSVFENRFARFVKCKYGISFPYGRSGLYALFKLQNIPKCLVLIPAYTCIVVLNAITCSGNKPSFLDISLKDYNMDLNKIETKISKETRIIIPTHMYGYPMDVKKLRDIVGDDVLIIEDAALALLSRNVGNVGDATFYSFNIAKQITTFDGSIVVTNNYEIYEKLKEFRDTNFKKPTFQTQIEKRLMLLLSYLIFGDCTYTFVHYCWQHLDFIRKHTKNWSLSEENMPKDFNRLYTGVQAKVGLAQIEKAREIIQKRVEIAKTYDRLLKGVEGIILPPILEGSTYSHYTIRVKKRERFIGRMEKAGVEVGRTFDYSIPFTPICKKSYGIEGDFLNSLIAANEIVNLPNYPSLKQDKIEHIVQCVASAAR